MHNKIKKYTNKVLLCCIAKMENNYIREFVEYYKRIGFDNICLYDNNDVNGEHFEAVIDDYIKSGFVIIKNIRGKKLA
ncbi:glycosyltransferase family 92 protein [bacterium]|nr:glycosyltransferase family 92 protein [bacterium]